MSVRLFAAVVAALLTEPLVVILPVVEGAQVAEPNGIAAGESSKPRPWPAGLVWIDHRWLTIDDACRHFASLEAVTNYRQLRDEAECNVDDQLQLAHWCVAHRLRESSRVHFGIVLQLAPDNGDARRALGIREYRGMMLTEDQIAALKAELQRRNESIDRWRPKLLALKRKFRSRDELVRQDAADELVQIDDASVLPAAEMLVAGENRESALAVVALMSRFHSQQTNEGLVRQALLSPFPQVRKSVAEALRWRSYYGWVPNLLSAMQGTIQAIQPSASGFPACYWREGPLADELYVPVRAREVARFSPVLTSGMPGRVPTVVTKPPIRNNVAINGINQQVMTINQRAAEVLAQVTGRAADADPGVWHRWWYDYNEVYYPRERPLQLYLQVTSCFIAGTPVTTWVGPRPIETIRPGDCVLAQDIETGELAFQPVIETTVRPPAPLLKIMADGATFYVTRGHPLWVEGQGWRMAKELKPGDMLHTPAGSLEIRQIEPWIAAEAYNLVVADFGTYFVTERRVLVHDNTLRYGAEFTRIGDAARQSVASTEH